MNMLLNSSEKLKSFSNENFPLQFCQIDNLIGTIIFIIILYFCYRFYKTIWFWEIVKDFSIDQNGCSENLNDDYPLYPNGWIPVLESLKLKTFQVEPITAFGRELVAFRGSNEQVYVLDAYCPHLGAHLGFGGKVLKINNEACIKCPFHGWTFRGVDGQCVKIPHNDGLISNAKLNVWDSIEINGFIYVWYHSDGVEPYWFPIEIPEIKSKKLIFRGRTEHTVSCYFQEIPENGADVNHLKEIHKFPLVLGSNLTFLEKYDFACYLLRHDMTGSWEASPPPLEHVAKMKLRIENYFINCHVMTLDLDVMQIGPACVHLEFISSFFGIKGAYIQGVIPIGPKKNKIIHLVYTEPSFIANMFSKFLLYGEAAMLERDIFIWNRKKFLKNPMLAKSERSLSKFRRWFKQFYSEKTLDW